MDPIKEEGDPYSNRDKSGNKRGNFKSFVPVLKDKTRNKMNNSTADGGEGVVQSSREAES